MLTALGVLLLLAIAGLAAVVFQVVRLLRSAQAFQSQVENHLSILREKQASLREHMATVETRAAELERAWSALAAQSSRLARLLDELNNARALISDPLRLLRFL